MTVYEFGPFRLEPAERQLRRDDQPVPLTPKAFDTLQALVERAGRAVRKDELMAMVWPDANVGEATLAQNIFALRKVLGDGAHRNRAEIRLPVRDAGPRARRARHRVACGGARGRFRW